MIKTIQTIASLIMCLGVSTHVAQHYLYGNDLNAPMPYLMAYFVLDLPFATTDMVIHHICCIVIAMTGLYHSISMNSIPTLALTLFSMEFSTIFFVMNFIVDRKYTTFLMINNLLFVTTFFKFRIYDYYWALLADMTTFNREVVSNVGVVEQNIFYAALNCFFLLNVYWFVVLMKMMAKQVIPRLTWIDPATIRKVLSYTCAANLAIALYVYSPEFRIPYLLDVTGISIVIICSYLFHFACGEYYAKLNRIDYVAVAPYYIADNVAIHLRALLATVAVTYGSPYAYPIGILSALLHGAASYYLMATMMGLKTPLVLKDKDPVVESFLLTSHWLTSIPAFVDFAVVAAFSAVPMSAANLVYITVVAGLVLKINPLYQFNHILFHLIMCAHNTLIVRSVRSANLAV